jgi:hypothetical protein
MEFDYSQQESVAAQKMPAKYGAWSYVHARLSSRLALTSGLLGHLETIHG